jgi:hypothetical protein
VEKFGHYLQFVCLLYCFVILWFVFVSPTQDRSQFSPYYVAANSRSTKENPYSFQTSSNIYHTNNFVIIKQMHFILIKWNFYDHYFIDVCTFLKKIMLVVRGIQNCEFSGPWGPNGWRPLAYGAERALEPVWTLWKKEKFHSPAGNRTPADQPVAIPTKLSHPWALIN